ncbi:multiple inositol polyphosphate phosphatase 1 [Cephus cinctus]|uniref:Multiple inositol polyphosphate phosphatase 1 n=1 Tax=Cephus cinctus TaxID=211228 RepID=A0AAJ7FM06_CEPCN|nr:multiple inositol polyphosphate phosphatase 1 [Cephus cinctus]
MDWKIFQLIVLYIGYLGLSVESQCLENNDTHKCKLGTKTPYRLIANLNDSLINYPGCIEKKIWLLVRHGTRFPGKKYVPIMMSKLPHLQELILSSYVANRSRLMPDHISQIAKWKLNFAEDAVMKLAEEGEREMIDLAERFQSRFPTLFPEKYSNLTYKFKYTATQRTEESAKHFALGLFGLQGSKDVWFPEPEYRDPILRFYKRCQRWRKEVDKNPKAYEEEQKFIQSSVVSDTLKDISSFLGFQVDYEAANLMYTICAFETAWYSNSESAWCNVFQPKHFKVLEFAEDLKYYWIDGYGYPLTYEQACPALRDMFNFFQSKEDANVTAYFTHSGTILKLLSLIRVAKDIEPLKHDSYTLHEDRRVWRVSMIDAFASNLAFVLYDCKSKNPAILVMHQERIVHLPGCPKNMPCPLSIMKNLYPDNEEECQFDTMCGLDGNV